MGSGPSRCESPPDLEFAGGTIQAVPAPFERSWLARLGRRRSLLQESEFPVEGQKCHPEQDQADPTFLRGLLYGTFVIALFPR